MNSKLKTLLIIILGISLFNSAYTADLDILVLGSTHSYSQDEYSSIPRNQNAFNPQLVVDELTNILGGDAAFGNVNVVFEDIYRTTTRNMFSSAYTVKCYGLLGYYYWPDGRSDRLNNLKGAAGTAWDYVIILGDPSFISNTPGVYAKGVKLIVDKVKEGTAQPILMMQWAHDGSSVPVADFGEVTYRVGDSGGIPVAPAGYAWDTLTGKDSGTHPTAKGAYLAAATLYSKIFDRDAGAGSTYNYDDALATHAYNTVQTHISQSHYTGLYNVANPYLGLNDKDRVIKSSHGSGSSTEQGFRSWGHYNNDRYFNILLRPQLKISNYDDDPSGFSGKTHFHIGRNSSWDDSKRYSIDSDTYRCAFAFPFQVRNQDSTPSDGGEDMLYGIDHLTTYRGDQRTAFDLISRVHTASGMTHMERGVRVLPIYSIWAEAKDELSITTPFIADGNHYREEVNEAAVSYMMTLLTGRCPIGKNDTAAMRTRRRIGYETAWIMSTLSIRPPGFTTQPSSYDAKTVTPGTDETMSVYFVNPPESSVTVNVSVDASTVAIVNPKVLTFDASNYDTIQNIRVTGVPGASSSEVFDVDFLTTSSDVAFTGLPDSWKYTNNRASTESLTVVDQADRQESVTKNVSKTIDLQVTGSLESNTTLANPFHGTLSWSGADVVYTPDADYLGNDSFAFAVNTGGTLTKGYIEITVEDLPAVMIVESDGSTDVVEGGATDTYTAVLNDAPTQDVTVTISPDAQVNVYPTTLTFTTGDWNTPQTVTVTAVNDGDHELNHNGTISHSTSSTDPNWDAISVNNVTANITDNNNQAPTVNAGIDQTVYITGSAWTPAEMTSSLVAWYDANDAGTITKDGSNLVSQWNDKSGNGNNAVQASGANQPTYSASDSMVNNMPSIGNISNSGQIGMDTPSITAKNVYVVTYYKDGQDASFDGYATLFSGPGSYGQYRVMAATGADFIGTSTFNDAGTYKNGSTTSSITGVLPMPASIFKFKASSARTQVFGLGYNQDQASRDWQGAYCEWIFTDGTEDAATEEMIEGYLAHKWGLEASLPAGHTYKSVAPGGGNATVNLDGTANDGDSDPLTATWTDTGTGTGTGSVEFSDPSSLTSTATFTATGTYVLRLTATDGSEQAFDEVTINVKAITPHAADTNSDWSISQTEVNSFILNYSSNSNSVTGDEGSITDGRITMREVMRVIYLYNDGGAYIGGQTGTVDGYEVVVAQQGAPKTVPESPEGPGNQSFNNIVISSTADAGVGSLRNAIAIAGDGETVIIDGSIDTITLLSEIVIDKSITIDGQGVAIVSGDKQTRIFKIENDDREINVTIKNIGIVDAENNSNELGGAIYNNGQTLNLNTVLFDGNSNSASNGKGGAVYSSGTLNIDNCVFTNNTAAEENDIYSDNGDIN